MNVDVRVNVDDGDGVHVLVYVGEADGVADGVALKVPVGVALRVNVGVVPGVYVRVGVTAPQLTWIMTWSPVV